MKNIINMTPHACQIVLEDGTVTHDIPASGRVIRLSSQTVPSGTTEDGIPLTKTIFGEIVGLPNPVADTAYIVSQIVKSAVPSRPDLLVPAEVVRNAAGVILGCKSLGM